MSQFGAPKWTPKWAKMAGRGYGQLRTGVSKKLVFPRWPQDGSRWPRVATLLGSSEAVVDSPGTQKTLKNNWFFKVFANAGFRYVQALEGPLGPIWSKMGPQNGPQSGPKSAPKLVQKTTTKKT